MRRFYYYIIALAALFNACSNEVEHTAAAISDRDSVSMMVSYGVNTLISDSGVMKYRIVAEEWEVNTVRDPSRWIFTKGLFMEKFDDKFHVEAYVQADTAFYYDQMRLWELRGNVRVRTLDGLHFSSEELFWSQMNHEFYSHRYSHLVTPERTLQGSYFKSDEHMTRYLVTNSKGSFESADMNGNNDNASQQQDSTIIETPKRSEERPSHKVN